MVRVLAPPLSEAVVLPDEEEGDKMDDDCRSGGRGDTSDDMFPPLSSRPATDEVEAVDWRRIG